MPALAMACCAMILSCGGRSPFTMDRQVRVHVIDIYGEPVSRKILAASLQGIANKYGPHVYLVDENSDAPLPGGGNRPWEKTGQGASQRVWLDIYRDRYGAEIAWRGRLDDAVKMFAREAAGYILVSTDEPWTINAATSWAGIRRAYIATADEAPGLDAAGLRLLDDLRGRWPDAGSCTRDLFTTLYPRLPKNILGIQAPMDYHAIDVLIQHDAFTIFGRPDAENWEAVKEVLRATPVNTHVFGYIADTASQEYIGVKELSRTGKYLNPSDTTGNLSFHGRMTVRLHPPPPPPRYTCSPGKLYVSIAISDGDNFIMPINWFMNAGNWLSPDRGTIPMGWSLSPALAYMAPAVADYYMSTATVNDELVNMLGIGYVYPSIYPDPAWFVRESLSLARSMGMTSWWQLDFGLAIPDGPAWTYLDPYLRGIDIRGFLIGYYNYGKVGSFVTPSGQPALVALGNGLSGDNPSMTATRIREAALSLPPETPTLLFISSTAWTNSYQGLRDALREFDNNPSIVFLTPSQALDCVSR